MGTFSNYIENKLLDATLRGVNFTAPTKTYLALFTADPTDDNLTGNEVNTSSFPAYSRKDIAAGSTQASAWTAPANGSTSNTKTITFPAHNGTTPVVITHVGIYDAATGGNLLYHGALVNPKSIDVTDVISFGIGSLTFTLD